MATTAITIRDVPEGTRAELAALAERRGLTAESFVRQRLIEIAGVGGGVPERGDDLHLPGSRAGP